MKIFLKSLFLGLLILTSAFVYVKPVLAACVADPCKTCGGGTCNGTNNPYSCCESMNECSQNSQCAIATAPACRVCVGSNCHLNSSPPCDSSKGCTADSDCCQPVCDAAKKATACTTTNLGDGCGGSCWGSKLPVCDAAKKATACTTTNLGDGCGGVCYGSVSCCASTAVYCSGGSECQCTNTGVVATANTSCSACANGCTNGSCYYQAICKNSGCGGSSKTEKRSCTDMMLFDCRETIDETSKWVSDGCQADPSCVGADSGTNAGACHPSVDMCGGNANCTAPNVSHIDNCGGIDCGPVCGSTGGNTTPGGCTTTSPATPTIISPVGGVEAAAASVSFSWNATTNWGNECTGTLRAYSVCVGTNPTDPCLTGGTVYETAGNATAPITSLSKAVTKGQKYWSVQSVNKSNYLSPKSTVGSVCVEGFGSADTAYVPAWSAWSGVYGSNTRTRKCTEDCGVDDCVAYFTSKVGCSVAANCSYAATTAPYKYIQTETRCMHAAPTLSAWSTCNSNHVRTRTCTDIDGVCDGNDCTGVALTEDCLGEIRGTLFDASEISSCPAIDANGYTTGVSGISGASFGMTDQSAVAPHPWSLQSEAVTNNLGNYAVSVFAPANYTYDFSLLGDAYQVSPPKLTCVSSVATVANNDTTCTTQPCTVLKGMSFGFWRNYGGWWQVIGGNVHAEDGITSVIPGNVTPVADQALILPSSVATGSRTGFLSYGKLIANKLGTNTNAKVSTSLWEKLSNYDGRSKSTNAREGITFTIA